MTILRSLRALAIPAGLSPAWKDDESASPMPLRDYLTELKGFLQEGNKLNGVDPALADFTNDAKCQ